MRRREYSLWIRGKPLHASKPVSFKKFLLLAEKKKSAAEVAIQNQAIQTRDICNAQNIHKSNMIPFCFVSSAIYMIESEELKNGCIFLPQTDNIEKVRQLFRNNLHWSE